MPVTNQTYAASVQLIERLTRELLRAKTHFQRIYKASQKTGSVEGECSAALAAINLCLADKDAAPDPELAPPDSLATIAKEKLGLATLETRNSDSLDFHSLAVWKIQAALEAAYSAGQQSGQPKKSEPTPADLAFIQAARNQWANDECEIDDSPKVSPGEDGAFVAAWVWVSNDDAGICRRCGAVDADNGEGFDGLCGECADKELCDDDDCDTVVDPEDPYYATPCGTYCAEHMHVHVKECGICAGQFPELASEK